MTEKEMFKTVKYYIKMFAFGSVLTLNTFKITGEIVFTSSRSWFQEYRIEEEA